MLVSGKEVFLLSRMPVLHLEAFTQDFPGGPVAKTPCFQCRVQGFKPWLGN